MRITDFKEGDLITRTKESEKTPYFRPGAKFRFLGIHIGLIWVIEMFWENIVENYPLESFDDDNWEFYPEEVVKEWEAKYLPKEESNLLENK